MGARAARPDLRAWSSLELLKPWKLNTTGMATPCAVSGTTMSYARSIPSCRNDSDRDPGDTPSLHHALSTPGAIAVGVDVAGLPWVGDPSGSPVVGLHAPAITTANKMGEAIPTDSLHRRSISQDRWQTRVGTPASTTPFRDAVPSGDIRGRSRTPGLPYHRGGMSEPLVDQLALPPNKR